VDARRGFRTREVEALREVAAETAQTLNLLTALNSPAVAERPKL
jgi:hypothetical protein